MAAFASGLPYAVGDMDDKEGSRLKPLKSFNSKKPVGVGNKDRP